MAKKSQTGHYTHDESRRYIPPARIAGHGEYPTTEGVRYSYSPHLEPQLHFDADAQIDELRHLVSEAGTRHLSLDEQKQLEHAIGNHEPWLEWAGKREQERKQTFAVDPIALQVHERISTEAITRVVMRQDIQRDLFADPEMSYKDAVSFYKHDVDWANRLILGDSLEVMASLSRRENLAGRVQMIYVDPPYGLSYNTNWQIETSKTSFEHGKPENLTREVEQIRAYRDTWRLGVHSYLSYLKQRLVASRELLSDTGSIFVQISDNHLHRVRCVLDEVFGSANYISQILYQKTTGFTTKTIASLGDYILWYGKDAGKTKIHKLYQKQDQKPGSGNARWVLLPDHSYRGVTKDEANDASPLPPGARLYSPDNIQSQGGAASPQIFKYQDKEYTPDSSHHWKANYPAGMARLSEADRIHVAKNSIRYRRYHSDFPYQERGNMWTDTITGSFTEKKLFVVQTNPKVVRRCIALTTDPGDLVLDPTCGSGTTALAAESLARRWIAIDTSRIAIHIARMRLFTATFDMYETTDGGVNPAAGLRYNSARHITLEAIANNNNIDAIADEWSMVLDAAIAACNTALKKVRSDLRTRLAGKLEEKKRSVGKKSVTDADVRRWKLPSQWQHWDVPFDDDPDWPDALRAAVRDYQKKWLAKAARIEESIVANADREELVDDPISVENVLRVTGPFTVEGVLPAETSTSSDMAAEQQLEYGRSKSLDRGLAYLDSMIRHLIRDGVTFAGNKHRGLKWLEPLYSDGADSVLHAEGHWDDDETHLMAVAFGPQRGPVTAALVEDFIRGSARYSELVIAGFSFDPEASSAIRENTTSKLRIHQAHIRPDINPSMGDLLASSPASQLFSVFGEPQIETKQTKGGDWIVSLVGVDIYDPLTGEVRSTGASKVAAWFLDADYDGRTLCVTQAFFPNQDAWKKIAKDLKSIADPDLFEAFEGTTSLPFPSGQYSRIAVKVIDPRGNEVMTTTRLGGESKA